MSFGFSETSSGSIKSEFNFSNKVGNFSFISWYGVFPPRISLGILLILFSNLFMSSGVRCSKEVPLGKTYLIYSWFFSSSGFSSGELGWQ